MPCIDPRQKEAKNIRPSIAESDKCPSSQTMWNSSQSGGGFMNDTNTNTPSKGASGGSGKNKKQNIVPVNIIQSLSF